jgi:D-glycero-alpha-D-manno-heptose 1-phosphate guanylyltransferase
MHPLQGTEAILLAGGLGTRLGSLVADCPKPFLPVQGRAFIEYQLDWLASHGVHSIFVSAGYRADRVRAHFQAGAPETPRAPGCYRYAGYRGLQITVVIEESPLGTGGALCQTLGHLAGTRALVLNADSMVRMDPCRLLEFHLHKNAGVSLLLTRVEDQRRYGTVQVDESGQVLIFREKDETRRERALVNAGIYLVEREVLAPWFLGGPTSFERDVLPALCGHGLWGLAGDYPLLDIGTPESYAAADGFLKI